MKIRSRNGETMYWVEKFRKIVRFENGFANVDENIGREMISKGYTQEYPTPRNTPKQVTAPKEQNVVVNKTTTQPKFKV